MLFSSPAFLVFFLIYLFFHVLLPVKARIPLIIVGSTIFYGYWNPAYSFGPPILILIAFVLGHFIAKAPTQPTRKLRMITAVVLLTTPLLIFKYANFIYRNLTGSDGHLLNLPLPLGISFITFTLLSYVIDIYLRKHEEEKDLPSFWACILYFPHLIAGPIVRPYWLIDQFRFHRPFNKQAVLFGFSLFTLGFFKKMVIGDQLANFVNLTFGQEGPIGKLDSLLAIYGFSVQIYCDFSGYTDMALGLSAILGVRLPQNFARPYAAASIVDFWRRWHITLSLWLRDYIYIPLGGGRNGSWARSLNVVITFVIGGLWHGANWTFVVWGLAHGLGVAINHLCLKFVRIPKWLGVLATFHFVTILWVFFRATSFTSAGKMLSAPFVGLPQDVGPYVSQNMFPIGLMIFFFLTHRYDRHAMVRLVHMRAPRQLYWAGVAVMWLLALILSAGQSAKFIYFDF